MRVAILLIFMLCEISATQEMGPHRTPSTICRGLGGLPEWGVKLVTNRRVRFTIDATLVDTCTEYYDLEFVAELLNSQGASIETRRFSAPNLTISGPTVRSFDFTYSAQDVAKVKGLALKCKKRKIGGLPAPPTDEGNDPEIEHARAMAKAIENEKKSYDEWLSIGEPEYYEEYVGGTSEMVCRSGSLKKTARQGDSTSCSDVMHAAEELREERRLRFGDPILPESSK